MRARRQGLGNRSWRPAWILGIGLMLWASAAWGQITDMAVAPAEVRRGVEPVVATIGLSNPSTSARTFYVEGRAQRVGSSAFNYFTPNRAVVTLTNGGAGSVQLSWAPTSTVTTGLYHFTCTLFRTSTGTQFYDQQTVSGAFSVIEAKGGEVAAVTFDATEVQRGYQTLTSTVTVHNAGSVPNTYYVEGRAQRAGTTGNYFFTPNRAVLTLPNGSTGTVALSWSPGGSISTGRYDFTCTLYKTSTGTQFHDQTLAPDAFAVVDPRAGAITSMVLDPTEIEPGYQTVTATITLQNVGAVSNTYYVDGQAQRAGSTAWNLFTPRRSPVTLGPGGTASVQVSWSPSLSTTLGGYGFQGRLYMTASGTDLFAEDFVTNAFWLVDPFASRASMTITLAPAEAVAGGARWRVDGGAWRASGTTVTSLAVGTHQLEFESVPAWIRPKARPVPLAEGQTYSLNATYHVLALNSQWNGGTLVLSWPEDDEGIVLEHATAPAPAPGWVVVTDVITAGGIRSHTRPAAGAGGYFRLRKP